MKKKKIFYLSTLTVLFLAAFFFYSFYGMFILFFPSFIMALFFPKKGYYYKARITVLALIVIFGIHHYHFNNKLLREKVIEIIEHIENNKLSNICNEVIKVKKSHNLLTYRVGFFGKRTIDISNCRERHWKGAYERNYRIFFTVFDGCFEKVYIEGSKEKKPFLRGQNGHYCYSNIGEILFDRKTWNSKINNIVTGQNKKIMPEPLILKIQANAFLIISPLIFLILFQIFLMIFFYDLREQLKRTERLKKHFNSGKIDKFDMDKKVQLIYEKYNIKERMDQKNKLSSFVSKICVTIFILFLIYTYF